MKSINLLPKPRQKELFYEILYHNLVKVFIISCLSFLLVFLVQFGAKFYLEAEAKALDSQIALLKSQEDKQQNADIKAKVTQINNFISDYNNLGAASPKWSKILIAFAPLPPPGIEITSMSIDPAKKSITIQGFSPTRETTIQLYNNILQDTKNFYNIDYPLENIVSPTNTNFHFTFYFHDSLMH